MRKPGTEKGQAAAEFGVIFPVIILLIFGVMGLSMFFYDCLKASNAARSLAGRVAAVSSESEADALQRKLDATVDGLESGASVSSVDFPEMGGLLIMAWDKENCKIVYDNRNSRYGAELVFKPTRLRGLLNYAMDAGDKAFPFACYIYNSHNEFSSASGSAGSN